MLQESDIIKYGGTHYIDKSNIKWIDLVIGEHKKLRFYNYGNGFNVYLCNLENLYGEAACSIQLITIETKSKFKSLLKLLYDKEGVQLYNELLKYK